MEEVLSQGRDRPGRRPGPWLRRHRRAVVPALAALAALAAPAALLLHERAEDRADRASVTAVQLALSLPVESWRADGVDVELRNDGPDRVALRSVRLDRAGDVAQRLPAVLLPGGIVRVSLTHDPPCTARLRTAPARALHVALTTARHQDVVVDVPLGATAELVNGWALQRCGYLDEATSFLLSVSEVSRRGRAVVVDALLRNDSVLPLRLAALDPVPGLSVRADRTWPLDLVARRAPGASAPAVRVRLVLRVTSCPAYLAGLRAAEHSYPAQLLVARLVREGSAVEVPVSVWLGEGLDAGTHQPLDPEQVLAAPCLGPGETVYGEPPAH